MFRICGNSGATLKPVEERTSLDFQNLGVAAAGFDDIADRFANQRLRQWRHVGQRSLRRIRLVFADNAECVRAAVVAIEGISGTTARYQRHVMAIAKRVTDEIPDVPVIVAAPYFSPRTRLELRRHGFSYADSTGNLYLAIESPPVFIEAEGADRDPWPDDRPLQTLRGAAAGRAVRAFCDFRPPYGIRELAQRAAVPAPTLSRVADLLGREGIVDRAKPRGPIVSVDWEAAIRLWVRDYNFLTSNRTSRWLEPRGLSAFQSKLKLARFRYALTGSLAGSAVAPIASPRLAAVYVERPQVAAAELGLQVADTGGNVVLCQPYDLVVLERGFEDGGLQFTAYTQAAADLLTGPGRSPAEGEELINWMRTNERDWRA